MRTAIHKPTSESNLKATPGIPNILFIIPLPPEFLPVLGLLTRWCASTLGAALLCSSRADSDLGLISKWGCWLCQFGSSSHFGTRFGPWQGNSISDYGWLIQYSFGRGTTIIKPSSWVLFFSYTLYLITIALPPSHHGWLSQKFICTDFVVIYQILKGACSIVFLKSGCCLVPIPRKQNNSWMAAE